MLRAYGRAAGADGVRWTLATGEPAAIAAFAERSGLYVDRPRPGLILHTEAVLIARDGILEETFAGNDWTAPEVAAEARSIATLPGEPARPVRAAPLRRRRPDVRGGARERLLAPDAAVDAAWAPPWPAERSSLPAAGGSGPVSRAAETK